MKSRIPFYLYIIGSLLALLAGCTSNLPYRRNLPDPNHVGMARDCGCGLVDSTTNCYAVENNPQYGLGFVEFDDQGWFWSYQQWESVKTEIKAEAAQSTNGLAIIVFVHGWKNNAADDNTNVMMFRNALAGLGAVIPRRVFGVYVGWRGLSTMSDYLPPASEELSFYNRKAVAERIGQQGAATQVFTELEVLQNQFNARTNFTQPAKRTELVIIGHSFGGALVYTAISQILTARLVKAANSDDGRPVQSLGDLVILLNPAFEASLYNNLMALATSPHFQYPKSQRPVLAIFTSKSDWATGIVFPIGRFFSTVFEKTREPGPGNVWETNLFNLPKSPTAGERKAVLETIGHDNDFINYDLNYAKLGKTSGNTPTNVVDRAKLKKNLKSLNVALDVNSHVQVKEEMTPYVFTNSYNGVDYTCTLQPRLHNDYPYKSRNPFLDVAVDKRIMDGHNDITNPLLLNFLRDFILFTTQTNDPTVAGN